MSILIKRTNIEDLQRAMLMFSGHEIVELPDHGDLIDRDALMGHECYIPLPLGNLPVIYRSYVKGAPVVIPAERKWEEE